MRFHGPFIGIDRYESPNVNWLACAKRDAVALHALFADTFGGESLLVVDEKATKAEIIGSVDASTLSTLAPAPPEKQQSNR